jgi:hypothetical protein
MVVVVIEDKISGLIQHHKFLLKLEVIAKVVLVEVVVQMDMEEQYLLSQMVLVVLMYHMEDNCQV